ncbi:MAG: hypothetical protein U0360_00105 [Dehalococcoidia bacterium]
MTSPYGRDVRLMLRAALALFVFTVLVGILNGTDLVDFDRKTLLTHVHAGTLGWITMSVLAGAIWLFSSDEREPQNYIVILARVVPLAITAYALAFLTTFGVARPILGMTVGILILSGFLWVLGQSRGRVLSVPHAGLLVALAMSVVGATLGVLLGYMVATPDAGLPESLQAAHPAAMVVGFLVPVGMSFIEWALDPESIRRRASIAGWLQVGLPFLGGLMAVVGLLMNIVPLLILGTPLEIIGLVILAVRMRSQLLSANPMAPTPARNGLMALIFLAVNIALLVYLINAYFSQDLQPPERTLEALDHSIFVGVMTNGIFALIARFRGRISEVADHVVFWGLNLGVAGFLTGLLLDNNWIIRISTPILGLALLHGIATAFMALGRPPQDSSMA